MLLDEKLKGWLIYGFELRGITVYVTRGTTYAAVYVPKDRFVSVIAAPGVSYHQAALHARQALDQGEFKALGELK